MKIRISFLLGLGLLLIATSAQAQSHTWVSGVGDDVNDCTRTAPCLTFARAILMTDVGGEISALDPGDFGAVTIEKSITINGDSTSTGILVASGYALKVEVTPGDSGVVILRGLSIRGGGTALNGIQYLAGAKLVIENCNIHGFTQSDIDVSLAGAAGNLVVKNTTLTGGASGISLSSTTGLGTLVQVTNSVIVDNASFGVHAQGRGTISVSNSLMAKNDVAVQAETDSTVRLSNDEIFDNRLSIGPGAGNVASAGDNKKAGNCGDGPRVCRAGAPVVVF
jgi:Right handed beta helix region